MSKKRKVTMKVILENRKKCKKEPLPYDPNRVMKAKCPSCPWRTDEERLNLKPIEMQALRRMVLRESNQYCHGALMQGEAESWICRGARDIQLAEYHAVGVLAEPTDKCWAETLKAMTS